MLLCVCAITFIHRPKLLRVQNRQDTATADDHVADGDDDDEADPEVFEHMLEIDEDDENMGELPDMEAIEDSLGMTSRKHSGVVTGGIA
eukprot:1346565-Amphidinium_carterae.1